MIVRKRTPPLETLLGIINLLVMWTLYIFHLQIHGAAMRSLSRELLYMEHLEHPTPLWWYSNTMRKNSWTWMWSTVNPHNITDHCLDFSSNHPTQLTLYHCICMNTVITTCSPADVAGSSHWFWEIQNPWILIIQESSQESCYICMPKVYNPILEVTTSNGHHWHQKESFVCWWKTYYNMVEIPR